MYKYNNLLSPTNWHIIESYDTLALLEDDLEKNNRVAFDTETTGLTLDCEVFGVVFCVGTDPKDRRTYWFNYYDNDEDLCEEITNIIRKIFTDGKWNVMFHNGAFDIRMVKSTFGIDFTHTNINDTMILALVLQMFHSVKLSALTKVVLKRNSSWDIAVQEKFLEAKIKEGERNYSDLPSKLIAGYASEDAENTFDLFFTLRNYYTKEPAILQEIYKMERRLVPVTSGMEYQGMAIDLDYFSNLKTKIEKEQKEDFEFFFKQWNDGIKEIHKKPLNMNSSMHIGSILFDPTFPNGLKLDRTKIKRTEKNSISIKGDYLETVFPENEIVQKIAMFRFKQAALTKYIEPIMEKVIHRDNVPYIHTSYFPIQTTGRYSSNNINLQNITNDKTCTKEQKEYSIRKGFIAPPGYLYAAMDFASFEVAILANASQDPQLVSDLLNGEDFHSRVASIAFHRNYDEIKNKIDSDAVYQRTVSKRTSFLFIYGGGINRAVETNNLTYDEAYAVKDAIMTSYPDMIEWRKWVSSQAGRKGSVSTLCGRKCRVQKEFSYRAINFVCQGTAADIMKYGHIDIDNILKGRKSKQIATIHDEIHFIFHPEDVDLIPDIVNALEVKRFNTPDYGARRYVPMKMEPMIAEEGSWGTFRDSSVEELQDKLKEL